MRFQDEGYIIKQQKYGESSLILTVVSKDHGKIVGFVKNCLHKKNLATFQLGNKISLEAYARLEENMLSLKPELMIPTAVNFLISPNKLKVLGSFCELSDTCLVQNENLAGFYDDIDRFFMNIHKDNWLENYTRFEFHLLDFLGIGLDLSKCAVTGSRNNLQYVSPKSGKAVSAEAGKGYESRLFKYPAFIFDNHIPQRQEIFNTLQLTEFFLKKNFFAAHDLKFPNNRDNLLHNLKL